MWLWCTTNLSLCCTQLSVLTTHNSTRLSCRGGVVSQGHVQLLTICEANVWEWHCAAACWRNSPNPRTLHWFLSFTWFLSFSVFRFLAWFVLFKVSQVQPQQEKEEKLGETKVYYTHRSWRWEAWPCRAAQTNPRVVRRQKTRVRAECRPLPSLGFLWEKQTRAENQVRIS